MSNDEFTPVERSGEPPAEAEPMLPAPPAPISRATAQAGWPTDVRTAGEAGAPAETPPAPSVSGEPTKAIPVVGPERTQVMPALVPSAPAVQPAAPQFRAASTAGVQPPVPPAAIPVDTVKKRRKWPGVLAAVALVALVATGVFWLLQAQRPKPSEAVKGYLDALAAGNAQAALAFAEKAPAEQSWLTDARLKKALEAAPLSGIVVTPTEGRDKAAVPATYTLGDRQVNTTFQLVEYQNGWRLASITADLDLTRVPAGTPVNLNGEPLPNVGTLPVFPGVYTFTPESKLLQFGSAAKVEVSEPSGNVTVDLSPTLSATGQQAVLAAVKASLEACLAAKTVVPANCPNRLDQRLGEIVDDTSVVWTLVNDPYAGFKPTLDPTDPTRVTGSLEPKFHLRAGLWIQGIPALVDQDVAVGTVGYTVNLADPKLAVTWE